jgi:hypothetical protein
VRLFLFFFVSGFKDSLLLKYFVIFSRQQKIPARLDQMILNDPLSKTQSNGPVRHHLKAWGQGYRRMDVDIHFLCV